MSIRALGVVMASLVLLGGCSGGASEQPPTAPIAETADPVAPEDTATEGEPAATQEASEPADGEATVLLGRVGTPEDPEAFVISLTDESGDPVRSLPAGDYTIQVSDPAELHNFHLMGPGVDETTSVPETVETTFEVTLEAGEYTYTCDPHPPMTGTFDVT